MIKDFYRITFLKVPGQGLLNPDGTLMYTTPGGLIMGWGHYDAYRLHLDNGEKLGITTHVELGDATSSMILVWWRMAGWTQATPATEAQRRALIAGRVATMRPLPSHAQKALQHVLAWSAPLPTKP